MQSNHTAEKIYFVLWFLNYNNLPINEFDIIKICHQYYVPSIIFYRKCLERLYKKNQTLEYYIEQLKLLNIINKDVESNSRFAIKIKEIIHSINEECDFINYNQVKESANKVAKIFLDFNFMNDNETNQKYIHCGLPIPDPEKGRPFICWKKCCYDGCNKIFNSQDKLIEHLESLSCYTPRYHHIHEQYSLLNKLNPEIIKEKDMIKCPVYICQNGNFKSPEQLIEHFTILGIEPFWKPGMIIKSSNKNTLDNIEGHFYSSDHCVICCENKPNIICEPCYHKIYCSECYINDKSKKCPLCRCQIKSVFPFA